MVAALVLYVDLEQAIPQTEEGRRAKEVLAAEHSRMTKEIRTREERLRELRDPAVYDREAEALQRDAAKLQESLDATQDELLAPIVEKMRKLLTEETVDLFEQPLIAPPKECDVTAWLVRAYAKPAPLPSIKGCRFRGFVYVDFDRALAQSAAGAAATRRLDAMKEKSQAEIDRKQRDLARLPRGERYERERRELAQLFARHQREMDAATRDAEEELYAQLQKRLASTAKQVPSVLFVEAIEEQAKREPHCDASDWAAALLDGKAEATELKQRCGKLMP